VRRDLLVLLGGRDLEMEEIGRLVRGELGEAAVVDKGLPWHAAAASAYREEIAAALAAGRTPVLVELVPDLPAALLGRCLEVDHHGARAGADRSTSLEQVWALLGLPAARWTRRLALVAANDRGWIPELRAAGATAEEIALIRAQDRAAQGVSAAEEAAAGPAIAAAERPLADLLLVRLPHERVSVVTDRLALAAAGDPPDVLVVAPRELAFSGRGARVLRLAQAFPGGWWGGALPERGFWGHARPGVEEREVLDVLQGRGSRLAALQGSPSVG
jgi:hypothetical protein